MKKTIQNNIFEKIKKKMKMDLEFIFVEESKKICKSKLSNKMFCKIFSHMYHYHKAIALVSQMNVNALRMLEDEEINFMQEMCEVDEDQETMFKLMETLKPLGLREENANFDIVFPSRNQLKLYLARMITKQRK